MMYEREQPHADGLDWLSLVSRRNRGQQEHEITAQQSEKKITDVCICLYVIRLCILCYFLDSRR